MTIRHAIAARLDGFGRVAVWGAGSEARKALRHWLPLGKVTAIIDSNPARQGETLNGIGILPPAALAALPVDAIVICSTAYLEIADRLTEAGETRPLFHVFELFPPDDGMSELERLRIDIVAQRDRDWFHFLMHRPQVLLNVSYRLCRWAMRPGLRQFLYYPVYILHSALCVLFSITLPPTVRAGAGLSFMHHGAVVLHPASRLGRFATLYHCATVGSNDSGEVPVIGDFVTLFKGASVLGRCRIGDHARIGAHALALDLACDDRCTVIGVPGRIGRRYRRPGP